MVHKIQIGQNVSGLTLVYSSVADCNNEYHPLTVRRHAICGLS
jgi:hypothetical protein